MNVDPAIMSSAADKASELLKSLSNRHRLLILCRLIEEEHSVGQLAAALDLRDSTVSQHLALLRKDGLVAARRDGQTMWYGIVSAPARRIVETLYDLFCSTDAAGSAAAAEAGDGESGRNGAGRLAVAAGAVTLADSNEPA
jgi:DNA-binding transcriptional ArsR family regulator